MGRQLNVLPHMYWIFNWRRKCMLHCGRGIMKIAKTLGYLTLATVSAGILVNLKDIRRYIRISMM